MSIESVMPSNHLSPSVVPFSSCLQSFPTSGSFLKSQLFTKGSNIRVPASASVLSMNIQNSFSTDWFVLLAVQGTLDSLLQHHSSKASVLWHSAFSMVQLSYPYMTTGETIALTMLCPFLLRSCWTLHKIYYYFSRILKNFLN